MSENIPIEAQIPTELHQELARLASARGETKAELVRRVLSEFALSDVATDAERAPLEAKEANEQSVSDSIDWNWTRWDVFDCVSVLGILLVILGFVAAVFPSLRAGGILVLIGLGCMTFAAYGAHRRDAHAR